MNKVTSFPKDLLHALKSRLLGEKEHLTKIKKTFESEDPFLAQRRDVRSADPIEEAGEEIGHANVETQKEQVAATLSDTIRALEKISKGTYGICERCKSTIEKARLKAYPQARFCLDCSKILEESAADEHVG